MIKTTISDIIVVFIFLLILINVVNIAVGDKIQYVISTINFLSMKHEFVEEENVKIELEEKKLTHYPYHGEKYGTFKIESIDVDLPLYYGMTLDILKRGVGHDPESYFPGEGGSILCMGHNSTIFLRKFGGLKIGDIININTEYGEFNYKIYEMKVVHEDDVDEAPIQKEEEIFMVYTCYPFNNIGYTDKRYIVYAKPVNE